MSKPLCRLCPKPAHFNFREGILLCAECAADILKLCEISESCGGVKESPVSTSEYNGVKSPALLTAHGLSRKSCPLSRSEAGPQDTSLQSSVTADQHDQNSQSLQVTEHDGIPQMFRRRA